MHKKVLFAVGGTGGHVFPALALADQLKEDSYPIEIHFAGGNLSSNKYFNPSTYPCYSFECGAFVSKNPWKMVVNGMKVLKGFIQARTLLKKIKPDLVVGFGSYHTFPLLLAAKLSKVPYLLHESNSIPGKVNRLMAPSAVLTGLQFPLAATHLKGATKVAGMPLRKGFLKGSISKQEARKYYGLDENKTTLLIFGGSQGAIALNYLVLEAIAKLKEVQVIHFTGSEETRETFTSSYQQKGISAAVKAFENKMEMAWQAADLLISRAGAGTIAEALEFEVPGILIPFPFAADNHQEKNGEFLAYTVGGGDLFIEKGLRSDTLRDSISSFFADSQKKLQLCQENIRNYKKSGKNVNFSSLVLENLRNPC